MTRNTNKGKRKFYKCSHHEHYYDDLTNVCLCHSRESGWTRCRCENIFQMNACPFFQRGDEGFFLKEDKDDRESVEKFLGEIETERAKKEAEERALLKMLKAKYEG